MYYRINRLLYEESQFVPIRLENVTETDVLWGQGILHPGPVPTPLTATLSRDGGSVMPDLDLGRPPMISRRLARVLKMAGVDNLQLFDLRVSDPDRGVVYEDYMAVNIVGAVSCADLDASQYRRGDAPRINFTKLVIDERRARGLHMFRLAESLKFVLVSQCVRDAIVSIPLVGVRISSLDEPEAYVG